MIILPRTYATVPEKRNNNKEIIVIFYILFFSYIAFNNDKVKCFRVENRSILVQKRGVSVKIKGLY